MTKDKRMNRILFGLTQNAQGKNNDGVSTWTELDKMLLSKHLDEYADQILEKVAKKIGSARTGLLGKSFVTGVIRSYKGRRDD